MMPSSYNLALVVASLVVAMVASYTALTMAARVATSRGGAALLWWIGGSFAMGFGIWAMHFVGMLAFSLPIQLGYDLAITGASPLIAIAASGFALWLVCQPQLPWLRLAGGAALLGTGIVAMHYSGMAALRMDPAIVYDPGWVAASVVIAVGASGAALWLAFRLRGAAPHATFLRMCAALVMGCAIAGMHYTGMAAAGFANGSVCRAALVGIDDEWLATFVIGATVAVLGFALTIAMLDARMQDRTAKLAASLAAANEQLRQMALHDHLTRLPNRALMLDRLEQAIREAGRDGEFLCAMLMDLDGFKAVNDGFGHHIGDQLLVEVARRMRLAVRSHDTIARLGGDEFVVLAATRERSDAALVADKLIAAIEQPYLIAGEQLHVSASIGIAVFPEDGTGAQELLAHADAAMYHVKEAGRNGYSFFEQAMNNAVQGQVQLAQQLRRGLEAGELLLHYQPKYRAEDGSLSGVEALLRWQHPQRGLLMPADFLPAAERARLMPALGTWVLREACRQLRAWRDDPAWAAGSPQSWSVAVNLSVAQLVHPSLAEVVREALADQGLLARWLTLEISEAAVLKDQQQCLSALKQLAQLGVTISLDQFGTGTSSLLYLKQFPARELKISRAFVQQLGREAADTAVVAALVALGRTLGLRIVAEGVETSSQQALLTAAGCDELQGYRLGKPMAASALVTACAGALRTAATGSAFQPEPATGATGSGFGRA